MKSLKELENRIAELELENSYLKTLLDNAGVAYVNQTTLWGQQRDITQKHICLKRNFTADDAKQFFKMFWGRTDVYSKRTVKKSTGDANYYIQCSKFWRDDCPKKWDKKIHCGKCENPGFKKLGAEQIIKHLKGESPECEDVIGIYPLLQDNTCRFIVFDFDNHSRGAEKEDYANKDEIWKEEVDALREICNTNGVDCLVERSRSGRGAHAWIFFNEKIEAKLARKFGNALLDIGADSVNLKSFKYYDRMLPMQDSLPKGGYGNLIALPMQGKALENGNSAFVDEDWNVYSDQWKILLSKHKLSKVEIEEKLNTWRIKPQFKDAASTDFEVASDEKPWNKGEGFNLDSIDGVMNITLADAIYVDVYNIKPMLQNQIRRLAAFSNPIYFKNQAMGLSNFENYRYIYLGADLDGYISIPRGLFDVLTDKCSEAGIEYRVEDKRQIGTHINVNFCGSLKESQVPAVEAILSKDTGILHAATAFGKTVVACNMIAKKKVNTLILVQSSTLMEQWESSLNEFLIINEELPKYETPTGRIKTRKSVIGKLHGAHDSLNGLIDIAMVGSLHKKDGYHPKLKEYGMVIIDECHHAASDTFVDILEYVDAKYVYGVTATPSRSDGLEKINYMLIGPIRYKYTSKDRAKEQGIEHFVIPRFTRAVLPSFKKDKVHPNEAYEAIRSNDDRDDIIISDIKNCIRDGRTPVVLSKYIDHSIKLYDKVKDCADYVFLLTGANSKKEHKKLVEEMRKIKREESLILVATGSLIGEGFDFPRLDTLIMATPVSAKNIVEQYAGRLNRDYDGKKEVIVYDYVDSQITMFKNMYNKRIKAYKQIGYSMYSENLIGEKCAGETKPTESIYDYENYKEIYERDLIAARKEIIISSPIIRGDKIDNLIQKLLPLQLKDIPIRIITWKPELYGFGDATTWMELHEKMRNAGFEVNLVENYCEHYCIVDRETVWYGSMNFLGKEDVEDNLMRVTSNKIASELLILTFGCENHLGELL